VSDRVFVYGTLQPGESTEDGRPRSSVTAAAASCRASSHARARVEDVALRELDQVEGVPHGLFERRLVAIQDESCWAWDWPATTAGLTLVDAWPRALDRRECRW